MTRGAPNTLLFLVLVTACQDVPATAPEYRPEQVGTVDHALCLLGFDAIPLRDVTSGHHLVQATINGKSGSFVLDTGANVTVVDRSHVGHFGLSKSGGQSNVVGGLGGAQKATQVSIDSLHIGTVEVRQPQIVVAHLGQLLRVLGQVSGTTVYGLIGQDVLKEHRAIVDVAAARLFLIAEDRDPAPIRAEACRDTSEPPEGR